MSTDAAPEATAPDHLDAAGAYSAAALVNTLSGIGGARDSGQAARPNVQRELLSDFELEALYRDTVYGRLCELMPDYATQRGWTVSDATPMVDPLEERMRALHVATTLGRADALARAYGRAAVWVVVDDAAPTISDPLDPTTIIRVHAIHALSWRDFSPIAWETDVRSPMMGKPRLYSVTPANTGRTHTVHATRLHVLLGDPLTPAFASDVRMGAPLAWRWWDAIRDLCSTSAAAARAAQELSVGIFRLANLAGQATGDQAGAFAVRMGLLNMGKSVANSIVIQQNEEYRRENIPASGFDGLSASARTALSLVTGYPEQLLYGTAPGGLNSDGDSWWRSWTNVVAAYQTRRYFEPVHWLCRCLYAEAGGEPEKWRLEFNPLGALDDKARAEIRSLVVAADATEIANSVLTPDDVRERYATGRYESELQPRRPVAQEPPDALTPEQLAAARARLSAALSRADADTYRPPAGAAGNARKVLQWREEHPSEIRGMTATGWARARQLASGDPISAQDVIEMRAWFARHGAQTATRAVDPQYEGEPWRDAGYVSWLGWGGDTARAWVNGLAARADAADALCLLAPLSPTGRAIHADMLARVREIVPDIEVEAEPHLTLLYLGEQSDPVAAVDSYDRARAILSDARPATLQGGRIALFEPAQGKPTPIVIEYTSSALGALSGRLTRALAQHVTAPQHDRYRPHTTLGYADRLTPEQVDALEAIAAPGRHTIDAATLRLGARDIGRAMPLGG
jgi:phage-related protein (TIGR01555 family)